MLDLNRLVGFVFCATSHSIFSKMRKAILRITPKLDNDDMAVVNGECYQSSGPITGAVANCINISDQQDFIDSIRLTVKSIGEARMNCPKLVFVISDSFNSEVEWVLKKFDRIHRTLNYEITLHVLQVNPTAVCNDSSVLRTIVDDEEALFVEIARILKEANIGSSNQD